jgi:hypothetical protein
MMNNIFKLIITSLLIILSNSIYSQLNQDLQLFPGPNSSAIASYSEAIISHYSGQPNISLSLPSITYRDFEIPVNLNYNSSGVVIDQRSGNCGLNWSLNIGAQITRVVRGQDDFQHDLTGSNCLITHSSNVGLITCNRLGYFELYNGTHDLVDEVFFQEGEVLCDDEYVQFSTYPDHFICALDGKYDLEPDKFIISGMNLSNSFVFEKQIINGKYRVVKSKDDGSLISYNSQSNTFDVIDNKGYIYHFEPNEITTSTSVTSGYSSYSSCQKYYSSWKLTSIESPMHDGKIELVYNEPFESIDKFINDKRIAETPNGFCPKPLRNTQTLTTTTTTGNYLSEIKCIDHVTRKLIDLTYNNKTGENNTSDKLLDFIKFYNLYENQVNQVDFSYESIYNQPSTYFREILKTVTLSQSNNLSNEYILDYFPGNLPEPGSPQLDIWGFYNGIQNTNRIDGNRTPDISYSQIGVLKSIQYPTGAKITLEFELHEFDNFSNAPVSFNNIQSKFTSNSIFGGGLRVKSITSDDGIGNEIKKNYKYVKFDPLSNIWITSGRYLSNILPTLSYPSYETCSYTNPTDGNLYTSITSIDVKESNSPFPISLSEGTNVGYSEVHEFIEGDYNYGLIKMKFINDYNL